MNMQKIKIEKRAKIIRPNYLLKAKVGHLTPNKETITKCQNVIDKNDVDFTPYAKDMLQKLEKTIEKAKSGELTKDQSKAQMAEHVMQLKANAPMFGYELVGNLANIMLNFLEQIKWLDQHVIEIVTAHHKTLSLIFIKNMRGDCGEIGKRFEKELKDACARYFNEVKEIDIK